MYYRNRNCYDDVMGTQDIMFRCTPVKGIMDHCKEVRPIMDRCREVKPIMDYCRHDYVRGIQDKCRCY